MMRRPAASRNAAADEGVPFSHVRTSLLCPLQIRNLPRLSESRIDIFGVQSCGLPEDRCGLFQTGAAVLDFVDELRHEGLGEFAQIIILVEALADAVDRRDGSEDEREGTRKSKHLRLRERLQFRAQRRLDAGAVGAVLAELLVLERADEVARELFRR